MGSPPALDAGGVGSTPTLLTAFPCSSTAERPAVNREAEGSSPSGGADARRRETEGTPHGGAPVSKTARWRR